MLENFSKINKKRRKDRDKMYRIEILMNRVALSRDLKERYLDEGEGKRELIESAYVVFFLFSFFFGGGEGGEWCRLVW